MEIENFTLQEFLQQDIKLVNEYCVALRYLKPKKTKRGIHNMKLKHVEMIKKSIDSGNDSDLVKIIEKVQKCTEKEVFEMEIIDFFGLVNSVKEQLKRINDAEQNALADNEANIKWEMVSGSERMAKFGILNTLDLLTGRQPHLNKKYLNMSYSEIFAILYKWKTEEALKKEMDNIKMK